MNPGDLVSGKYRVERVLGSGGMGVVVAATHTELDQPVALKFILPEAIAGKDAVERFTREARAVARLKSEHVARVFDVGRDESGNPYMVLELLEGMDLSKLNKQKGPLPIADAVEYVLQACEALVEAHAAGIVHRDLKPQNLFVGRRLNGSPLVKVLDFGIAKAVGAAAVGQMALTDSQAVMGSPLYMAPEHMRSARAADVRSDIWSLGVILYELLGGQLPFDGETVTEVCIRVVNEPPPSLLTLRPGLDPKLVALVMRCLEKDPAKRWQNVAQLATELEPFSRSAQQGAVLRPWRSFEDTLDSHPPAQRTSADETGPSTAVTMPTGEDLSKALRGSSGPSMVAAVTPIASPQLLSTNVSWGKGTDPRAGMPAAVRPRSFTKGIAVGIVVSVVAVAAVIAIGLRAPLGRSTTVTQAATSEGPAARPSVAEPPPVPVAASSVVTAAAPVTADTSMTPASLPNATPPAAPKPRGPFPAPRTKPTASAGLPVATATVTPVPVPAATDTQAPNGAPILR